VSETQVTTGWCYLCNTAVEADVQAHFNLNHQTPATKARTPIRSWQHRLDQVLVDLGEVKAGRSTSLTRCSRSYTSCEQDWPKKRAHP